jgi:hypothetical protein
MDEVDGRLEDHATVRVLLVPVGGISAEDFDRYCRLFEGATALAMSSLTHPDHWAASQSPFKHFSWGDGALKLRWLRSTDAGDSIASGIAAAGGCGSSAQWANFAAHRKVFGVVGVLHFPTWQAACQREAARRRQAGDIPLGDAAGGADVGAQLRAALDRQAGNVSSDALVCSVSAVQRVCVFGRALRPYSGTSSSSRRSSNEASSSSGAVDASLDGGGSDVLPLTLALGPAAVVVFPPDEWAAAKDAGRHRFRIVELHAQVLMALFPLRTRHAPEASGYWVTPHFRCFLSATLRRHRGLGDVERLRNAPRAGNRRARARFTRFGRPGPGVRAFGSEGTL